MNRSVPINSTRPEVEGEPAVQHNAADEGMRLVLDDRSNSSAIILSAACGVLSGAITVFLAENLLLQILAMIVTTLALFGASVCFITRSAPLSSHAQARLKRFEAAVYPGLGYSAAVGVTCATALLSGASQHLLIMLFAYALVFGAGIVTGFAGLTKTAPKQLACVFLPIVIACMITGSLPLLVLALILPVMAFALVLVARGVHATLSAQMEQANANALQAEAIRQEAYKDVVTALLNRAGFEHYAQQSITADGVTCSKAMFWLDLYRFKEINDTLSHAAGDKVLAEVAKRLRKISPEGAIIARFGSDEFMVLVNCQTHSQAQRLAETMCEAIATPIRIKGHRIEPGVSIGVAMMFDDALGLSGVMEQADQALYHARIGGRDAIRFHEAAMSRKLARLKEIEAELRSAIQKDELSIYFQPVIDLKSGRIRSFEALVRWFHPDRGELLPSQFIPAAEETGLIITLGNWITKQAAKACSHWPEHIHLSINLSPSQIRAPGAALGLMNALRDAQLDPSRLELEVTENLFLEDDINSSLFMNELAENGVRFVLDDFGTGHSAISNISSYPFYAIKLDRSLIADPLRSDHNMAIMQAMAQLGASLDLDVVAEGIETEAQLIAARQAGCTMGQGYFFARPVPEHMAAKLLADEIEQTQVWRKAV